MCICIYIYTYCPIHTISLQNAKPCLLRRRLRNRSVQLWFGLADDSCPPPWGERPVCLSGMHLLLHLYLCIFMHTCTVWMRIRALVEVDMMMRFPPTTCAHIASRNSVTDLLREIKSVNERTWRNDQVSDCSLFFDEPSKWRHTPRSAHHSGHGTSSVHVPTPHSVGNPWGGNMATACTPIFEPQMAPNDTSLVLYKMAGFHLYTFFWVAVRNQWSTHNKPVQKFYVEFLDTPWAHPILLYKLVGWLCLWKYKIKTCICTK